MAKNTGDNTRQGAVKDRSQCYNEKNGLHIKRDAKTGRFMSAKKTPYKGVSKEKSSKEKKK
jgi:hypothetical protein